MKMVNNHKSNIAIQSINSQKQNIFKKYNEEIALVMGVVLFVMATVLQSRIKNDAIGWQGVIAQFQVLISIFLVIYVPHKGYIASSIMNVSLSIVVTLQVVVGNNPRALPGIVIPVITLIIVSVIELYGSRLSAKAKEVSDEKSKRVKEILELQEVSIMAMAALAETRDHETGRHIQRTKLYVKILANYLYDQHKYPESLSAQNIELMIASAPLHDIGKVGIPDSILLKPGKLSDEEFDIIKTHTSLGYEAILKAENLMGKKDTLFMFAQEIILYHHERWDGKGYLKHLKGENIPLSARIMSLADMYDALTSKRVYKEIHSHKDAYNIIVEESGKKFDPEIVKAFINCHVEFENIAEAYSE